MVLKSPETLTNNLANPANSAEAGDPPLSRLLNLFPAARRLHVSIHVDLPGRIKGASEKTTILFGTPDIAIFLLKFPVTGGSNVLVRPTAEKQDTPGVVVALMPYGRGLVVAVRFPEVPKWFSDERTRQANADARTPSFMTPR